MHMPALYIELSALSYLSQLKEIVDILQAIVTIIAIIAGGIWGYWLFVQNRQRYPRASIAHHITHRPIADDKLLLHITITVSNIGDILLSLAYLEIRIQQVLPPPTGVLDSISKGYDPVLEGQTEIDWPGIHIRELRFEKAEYEIEPGENHEFHHDFILNAEVQTIAVYSYLKNEKKRDREIGWDSTTVYDLKDTKAGENAQSPS
jgi:hypothetical protein